MFAIVAAVFGACSEPESRLLEPPPADRPAPVLSRIPVDTLFATREGPIATTAKIFLVAGSSQSANFAEEVLEQRGLWRRAGFGDDEIACYYVVPYQEEFDDDREQFLRLVSDLADCFPASAKLLREHLGRAEPGPFVYLYITAHGQRPVSLRLQDSEPGDDGYETLVRRARYPVLDRYRITIEALPDGTASESEILGAYRAGVEPRDLYLTPAFLAETLGRRYRDTPKFVVLQACFSGGFIAGPDVPAAGPGLRSLRNITALTAARHDRESFGCGHGEDRSYYGAAFNDHLARVIASPPTIDWAGLHQAVRDAIAAVEEARGERPSHPSMFSDQLPR